VPTAPTCIRSSSDYFTTFALPSVETSISFAAGISVVDNLPPRPCVDGFHPSLFAVELGSSAFLDWQCVKSYRLTMDYRERIVIDPSIRSGKPCIRGLRYPVSSILELLASGMTSAEILADYEDLVADDLLACLEFAARLSDVKSFERTVARDS